MARPSRDVTDTELAVLEVLWREGSATIRRITDLLYPAGAASHYATVQKLLDRLENKDCVARDRLHQPHVFKPVIARGELIERRLRDVADRLCGGSLTPLLTQLVSGNDMSAADRRALRELIAGLDAKSAGRERRPRETER